MASSREDRMAFLESEVARKTQWIMELEVELRDTTNAYKSRVHELEYENDKKEDEYSDLETQMKIVRGGRDHATDIIHGLGLELAGKRAEVVELQRSLKVRDEKIDMLDNTNAALRMQVEQALQLMDKHHEQRDAAEHNLKTAKRSGRILRQQEAESSRLVVDERQKIASLSSQLDETTDSLRKKDKHCSKLNEELEAVKRHVQRLETEAAKATKLEAEMDNSNGDVAHAKTAKSPDRKRLAAKVEQLETKPQLESKLVPGAGMDQFKYNHRRASMPMPNPALVQIKATQTPTKAMLQQSLSQYQQSYGKRITTAVMPAPTKMTPPSGPQAGSEPVMRGWPGMTLGDIRDVLVLKKVSRMAKIIPSMSIYTLHGLLLGAFGDYDKALNHAMELQHQTFQSKLPSQSKPAQHETIDLTSSDAE